MSQNLLYFDFISEGGEEEEDLAIRFKVIGNFLEKALGELVAFFSTIESRINYTRILREVRRIENDGVEFGFGDTLKEVALFDFDVFEMVGFDVIFESIDCGGVNINSENGGDRGVLNGGGGFFL